LLITLLIGNFYQLKRTPISTICQITMLQCCNSSIWLHIVS